MRIIVIVAAALLATPSANAAAAGCAGSDPAITSVRVANVANNGLVNHYTLVGTIANLGNQSQAKNVLQFVDIYYSGNRINDRGIPPLAPGQSYNFSYDFQRSTDAGTGTTQLHFRIRFVQPSPPGSEDCDLSNDTYVVRF